MTEFGISGAVVLQGAEFGDAPVMYQPGGITTADQSPIYNVVGVVNPDGTLMWPAAAVMERDGGLLVAMPARAAGSVGDPHMFATVPAADETHAQDVMEDVSIEVNLVDVSADDFHLLAVIAVVIVPIPNDFLDNNGVQTFL